MYIVTNIQKKYILYAKAPVKASLNTEYFTVNLLISIYDALQCLP